MANLEILVETVSKDSLAEIFEMGSAKTGSRIEEPNAGIALELTQIRNSKGFGFGEIAILALIFLGNNAVALANSVFANWLYSRLSGRVRKIEYMGKSYRVAEDDLLRLVEKLIGEGKIDPNNLSAEPKELK